MRQKIRPAIGIAVGLSLAWILAPGDTSARVISGKVCSPVPKAPGDPIDCNPDYGWAPNLAPPAEATLIRLLTASDTLDTNLNGIPSSGEGDCTQNLASSIVSIVGNATCSKSGSPAGTACDPTDPSSCTVPCVVCEGGQATADSGTGSTGLTCPGLAKSDGDQDGSVVFHADSCDLPACTGTPEDPEPVRDTSSFTGFNLNGDVRDASPGSSTPCATAPPPHVTITKSCTSCSEEENVKITVRNTGEGPATNCTVTDTLDPNGTPTNVPLSPDGTVPFDLGPGDSKDFTGSTGALSTTTLNSATITCDPNDDAVTTATADAQCSCGEDYKCYKAKFRAGTPHLPIGFTVGLEDQFQTSTARILAVDQLCNPVDKNGEGIANPFAHLVCYKIVDDVRPKRFLTSVSDQFGTETLVAANARELCIPALKNPQNCTDDCPTVRDLESVVNHYQCYDARPPAGTSPLIPPGSPLVVNLEDQFETKTTDVFRTHSLCNPVEKLSDGSGAPIVDPSAHLKCYDIRDSVETPPQPRFSGTDVTVEDQFSDEFETQWQMQVGRATQLCEPATKEILSGRPNPLPTPGD